MSDEMVGKKYARLTVLRPSGFRTTKSGYKHQTVLVKCDCGEEFTAIAKYVRCKSRRMCDKCQVVYQKERGAFRGMRIYS